MKTKNMFICIIILVSFKRICIGQDTTSYFAGFGFTAEYYFIIKQNPTDTFGFFNQYIYEDDFSYGRGWGKFSETKNEIVIYYDSTGYYNHIEYLKGDLYKGTIDIRWYNWWGEYQNWYCIKSLDNYGNELIFKPNNVGVVEIPISKLTNSKLSFYPNTNSEKVYEFSLRQDFTNINLFVNDPRMMGAIVDVPKTLHKNEAGLKTLTSWSREKPVQFAKRKE